MKQIIKEVVNIFYSKRPYLSNNMLTPKQIHKQDKLKVKTYQQKKQ